MLNQNTKSAIDMYMPNFKVLDMLASYFSAYSDVTRIKILSALSISEMCVGDISCMLDINQTTISHQLKLLKSLSLVKYKRQGKLIYYSLSCDKVNQIMLSGVEHLQNNNLI